MNDKVSYCATHNTYLEAGEPCWMCANHFILEESYAVFANVLALTCPYCEDAEPRYCPVTEFNTRLDTHTHRAKAGHSIVSCRANPIRMAYPAWSEQWNREQEAKA